MKVSGVGNYVQRMPEGLLTQIGRNGARLSGGGKQKSAVARAIVKDAPIIFFDEATSNFDVESDAYFRDVVSKQMKDRSVILITHHYEDLSEMDRVYRLTDGILTEIDSKGFSHSQDRWRYKSKALCIKFIGNYVDLSTVFSNVSENTGATASPDFRSIFN